MSAGHVQHGEALLLVGGPVVETRQDMGMNVDEPAARGRGRLRFRLEGRAQGQIVPWEAGPGQIVPWEEVEGGLLRDPQDCENDSDARNWGWRRKP